MSKRFQITRAAANRSAYSERTANLRGQDTLIDALRYALEYRHLPDITITDTTSGHKGRVGAITYPYGPLSGQGPLAHLELPYEWVETLIGVLEQTP